MTILTRADKYSWADTVRNALENYREFSIPEGKAAHDAEWDEICTAMAWIEEEMGL